MGRLEAVGVAVIIAWLLLALLTASPQPAGGCVSWQNGALVVSDAVACAGWDAGSNR